MTIEPRMGRLPVTLLTILAMALAAPIAAAGREPAAKAATAKKTHGGAFIQKPIEPAPEREEKPRGGWNGFYGGLNGGGASGDR
ncbi:hypothetical protein [Methylocystis echinoides]|uniref:hypothetical protein n=1 Tax=Methylocystis echinoides TaxID=29468 RepID=UPI00343C0545